MRQSQLALSAILLAAASSSTLAFGPAHITRASSTFSNIIKPTPFRSTTEQLQQQVVGIRRQHQQHHSARRPTSLAAGGFAVAAITGAISGGFFAGSLHAFAGECERR